MLRKNTLLLIVASLSLGVGIGLNATVFSVVHSLLFRGPAVERSDQLVNFYSMKEGVRDLNPNSYADFLDMRERLRSVDALVGYALATVSYERRGVPAVQVGAVVTSGYFDLLETRPGLGRLFQDEDFAVNAPVVVVSDRFWRDELGGSTSAIGSPVRIGGHLFDVVGVLPNDFVGFSRGLVPDIFVPITQLAHVQPMGESTADGQANGRTLLDWRGYRFRPSRVVWLLVRRRHRPRERRTLWHVPSLRLIQTATSPAARCCARRAPCASIRTSMPRWCPWPYSYSCS
jgi:hypothetical protein